MTYYQRPLSSYKNTIKSFYTTTLHPPSFYSPKRIPVCQSIRRTYTTNYFSGENNKDNNNIYEKTIKIFSSNKNKSKPTPFYNNEKSLRIQDEINFLNSKVTRKSKINKLVEVNTMNNIFKKKQNEMSNLLRRKIRLEQLDNRYNDINNRKNSKIFNYVGIYLSNKGNNPYFFNINKNYERKGMFNNKDMDNFTHKIFMNQMINFKNDRINKWKNEFRKKFNEY